MKMQSPLQTPKNSALESGESATPAPRVLLAETSRLSYIALFALDLAKAGCDVSFVCPVRHPVLKTRAVGRMFRYDGLRPLDSLRAAIEATNPDIVIPCDDRAVGHLHELHARTRLKRPSGHDVAALIEKSLGPAESYPIVSSRYQVLKIAGEEGLRVPDTQQIKSETDLESWKVKHELPWVLKASGTYGGHGVKIVETREQAVSFLAELSRYYTAGRAIKRLWANRDAFWVRPWWDGVKPAVIAQSYIHGRPANCAVVCWRGTVLAGVGVDVVSSIGTTAPAAVVRVSENPDMMLSAERIARRLNLSGFIGLDFMIENGTGLTWLIEMNPRPTRPTRLQLGKGRDQIGALCAQLSGRPPRSLPPVTENKLIAYFPDAWDTKSEFLESSYHDIPEGEPGLLEEIRRPWPTGTLRWRMMDWAHDVTTFFSRFGPQGKLPVTGDKAFKNKSKSLTSAKSLY